MLTTTLTALLSTTLPGSATAPLTPSLAATRSAPAAAMSLITSCRNGITFTDEGQHQVSHITAQYSQFDGFAVFSDRNRLARNTTNENGNGFEVCGSNNTVSRNTAFANVYGLTVNHGLKNKVLNNSANTNNGGIAVRLSASQTTVSKNQALNNSDVGITVLNDSSHKILGNSALDNGYLDLADDCSCGSNVWKKNIYVTKDPDCIQ